MNQKFNTVSSFILALCALVITGLVVQRKLSSKKNRFNAANTLTHSSWISLLNGEHHQGPLTAPIKLIEFSDFQCPYCKELEPRLQDILKKYPGKIEFIYYNFPLPMHPQAFSAAKAAECAAKQNDFFAYHDLLYQNQASFSQQPWDSLAQLANIKDMQSFNQCLTDSSVDELIQQDKERGRQVGVSATPTLLINGKMITGAISEDRLDQLVQQAL